MPKPPTKSKFTALCDGDDDEVLELLMKGKEGEVRRIVLAFFDTYLLSYKKLTALSGISNTAFISYKSNKRVSENAKFRIYSLYCNLKNHPEKTAAFLRDNQSVSTLLKENLDSNGNLVMTDNNAKFSMLYTEYWCSAQKMSGFIRVLEKHSELMNGSTLPLKAAVLNDVAAYFGQEKVSQLFPAWFVNSVTDNKFYRLLLNWYKNKKIELATSFHKAAPHGAHSSQQY